jgi:hypothetical protein
MDQMSLFDIVPEEMEKSSSKQLHVVKARFIEEAKLNWRDLFEGFNELHGITYSSGIEFMEKIIDMFDHVEMIFGCEDLVDSDLAAVMAMETKSVELIAKSKCSKKISEKIDEGRLVVSVSRDTKSHEKVFVLKSHDGRTRVITGSANMSASAFCGMQREDIVCFDDKEAYDYYKTRFDMFQQNCADNVNQELLLALGENQDYVRDNIDEIPIIKTIEKKKMIILETNDNDNETEIIADIKGLEAEMKPLIPKQQKEKGKLVLTGEFTRAFSRKYHEQTTVKKEKAKKLPKLHVDYENEKLFFNDKEMELNPTSEQINSDIKCLGNYMSSLSAFYGDWKQSQKDYYQFMNWYFASLFMPYLRYVGSKNNYEVTPFPVYGIIYGDSNGGKSTFIKLLSKLMCGIKIPMNSSNDFTSGNIESLKRACEGLPINVDDLAKAQYDAHYEKVIKDDAWGIAEGFINYPAVTISTNKIAAFKSDISKRTVMCFIGSTLDKEAGAKNSKRINESMRQAKTALYCEYVRRMLSQVIEMAENMKIAGADYFPDILNVSSLVLKEIFEQYSEVLPDYITELSYSDYFGDKAIGRNAMRKIIVAWDNDKKNFVIDRKRNTLTYTYEDSNRTYELKYVQQELPPILEAKVVGSSIVMNLEKAEKIFAMSFKKRFWK